MAYSFGDGFDLYSSSLTLTDAASYWDTTLGPSATINTATPGRFTGSRCIGNIGGNATLYLTKTSGANDAVHHIVLAFQQTSPLSGSTSAITIALYDGTTAQCSIVFRNDGTILFNSGIGGTTLATYTGAVVAINTWYAFEFEIVINNTTGSFTVRRNGNTSADFTATGLNTRVSANNYANKIGIGSGSGSPTQFVDDLFWQSGAATGTWLGDIRCYTRMPASDQSVQFSRSAATFGLPPYLTGSNAASLGGNQASYMGFTSQGSSLSSVIVTMAIGYTGNLKCAIFACTSALGAAASVGAILGTATASIANPVTGANTFTFSPAISLPAGTLFYVGIVSDTSTAGNSMAQSTSAPTTTYRVLSTATTYAAFPTASPALSTIGVPNFNVSPQFTATNALFVSEPQQDGLTSYVYDSTVNDADFYSIAAITSVPVSTIAVTTRGYMQKSDAGSRTAAVQLKSGSTTVATPTLTLTTSGFQWAWRTDLVDPNTSAAWIATAVNSAQIGPLVVS